MFDVFQSLKVVLIIANSADPDEMQQDAVFHLGLHCLPEYLYKGLIYFYQQTEIKWRRDT